jgi:hypothetical protein
VLPLSVYGCGDYGGGVLGLRSADMRGFFSVVWKCWLELLECVIWFVDDVFVLVLLVVFA